MGPGVTRLLSVCQASQLTLHHPIKSRNQLFMHDFNGHHQPALDGIGLLRNQSPEDGASAGYRAIARTV